ncbi:MAG: YifB family Mg chelatase-like AAA ATPase [Lachnospiraceae bacterium]|nr:YifB family Mg chelatase-like AAA ATPase [Lachnospiraceae bacterium]
MYTKILSGATVGVNAYIVETEVDISNGLPMFNLVGSIGNETREARERVTVALKNNGICLPASRITVNLSPADMKKDGTGFDLSIAVGLLHNMGYFGDEAVEDTVFLGELSLYGDIKKVKGVLPIISSAAKRGIKRCVVPLSNLMEAAVVPGIEVYGAGSIVDVLSFLSGKDRDALTKMSISPEEILSADGNDIYEDFSEIAGQQGAKRAAKIAACGFHNFLMTGPPGSGKSMIARRIPGIMPPLTIDESLELTSIVSVAGLLKDGEALATKRPYMNPHHSISEAALVGGGRGIKPGMISLAHRGVLFMDELPEFGRSMIDCLRQPLEDRKILISRADGNVSYPADFMLVCAMNPCPCGYYPDRHKCRCTESQMLRYISRISGPILDRIDLCVELHPVDVGSLSDMGRGETSENMRKDVMRVRAIQDERFKGTQYRFNSDIKPSDIQEYCRLGSKEEECMKKLYEGMGMSARTYYRVLRVARTIADISESGDIKEEHIYEAACYRPDEKYWRGR